MMCCLFRFIGSPYQQPLPPQQPQVVVVQTPQIPTRLLQDPLQVTCPTCHATVTTVTEPMNGLLTWIIVAILCIFGSAYMYTVDTGYVSKSPFDAVRGDV